MTNADTIYVVKNRSDGMVVYSIPEHNIRREFMAGESKKIKYFELEQLSYRPGGRALMTDYLQISDPEVLEDLGVQIEPEYFLSEEQVVDLVKNGSIEAFLDCLDFAPDGVINLVKKYAVELPMTDTQKRRALKAKTGFDVDAAVRNSEPDINPSDTILANPNAERRVKPADEAPVPAERRVAPKYNVIKKED